MVKTTLIYRVFACDGRLVSKLGNSHLNARNAGMEFIECPDGTLHESQTQGPQVTASHVAYIPLSDKKLPNKQKFR